MNKGAKRSGAVQLLDRMTASGYLVDVGKFFALVFFLAVLPLFVQELPWWLDIPIVLVLLATIIEPDILGGKRVTGSSDVGRGVSSVFFYTLGRFASWLQRKRLLAQPWRTIVVFRTLDQGRHSLQRGLGAAGAYFDKEDHIVTGIEYMGERMDDAGCWYVDIKMELMSEANGGGKRYSPRSFLRPDEEYWISVQTFDILSGHSKITMSCTGNYVSGGSVYESWKEGFRVKNVQGHNILRMRKEDYVGHHGLRAVWNMYHSTDRL